MRKAQLILLFILAARIVIGQNEKVLGGCTARINNYPVSIWCKNTCHDTLDLCAGDSIHLSFTFGCMPSSPTRSHIRWLRNGVILPNDTLYNYTVLDTGTYSCQCNYTAPWLTGIQTVSIGYIKVICSTFKNDTITQHNHLDTLIAETKLYPNPTTGYFTIEPITPEPQTIELIDISGKLVFTQLIKGKTEFDFSAFDKGVYKLTISNGINSTNKRLLIVR